MRLTVVQCSIAACLMSDSSMRGRSSLRCRRCKILDALLVRKATSDRENCHASEFRRSADRAPPSLEPGGRIRSREINSTALRRAPQACATGHAPGATGSYAAGDGPGERGLPEADRCQPRRMAEPDALP